MTTVVEAFRNPRVGMNAYWCANCEALTDLDMHGRCERCESNAVDIAVRPCVTAEGLYSAYGSEVKEAMPDAELLVGEAWIIARDPYGEISWYLNESELRKLDTVLERKREGKS